MLKGKRLRSTVSVERAAMDSCSVFVKPCGLEVDIHNEVSRLGRKLGLRDVSDSNSVELVTALTTSTPPPVKKAKCRRHRKRYMQRLVTQQLLVDSASLLEILLTAKICSEKEIVRCTLPRKGFPVPFIGVNYCRIYSVDLAKDVLKTS